MRLIDAKTLRFVEFTDQRKTPKYAILSHTWGEDEVTYADFISPSSEIEKSNGYAKVRHSARQAVADGLQYVWVDTCCIDKSSSAELSEAINSMFQWYRRAAVCYVHLADLAEPRRADWADEGGEPQGWTKDFLACRWFTRGWTLQELIAPLNLVFYTHDWRPVATKKELCQTIARYTGIASPVLMGANFRLLLVGERMRWAAGRTTTRVEDMAYCLLGIFNINMPLLYGEGERAFLRLQQEVMKSTNDRSLFCWSATTESHTAVRGFFAKSPAEFESFHNDDLEARYGESMITQRGLEIPVTLYGEVNSFNEVSAILVEDGAKWLMVRLRKLSGNTYVRVDPHELFPIWNDKYNRFDPTPRQEMNWITVPIDFDQISLKSHLEYRLGGVFVEYIPHDIVLEEVEPKDSWNPETQILSIDFSQDLSLLDNDIRFKFRPLRDPDNVWNFNLTSHIREYVEMTTHVKNKRIGYAARCSTRFVDEKIMIVLKVSYFVKFTDERK